MNKKITSLLLAASLTALSLSAYAFAEARETEAVSETVGADQTDTETAAEPANPNLYALTADDVLQLTGISLAAPEDAKDVTFAVIDCKADFPIAEMDFTKDGKEYFLRAQKTDKTDLYEATEAMTDMEADPDDLMENAEAIKAAADDTSVNFSGIYTEWTGFGNTVVGDFEGVSFSAKDSGIVVWLDQESGIIYNLCSMDTPDNIVLQDLANEICSVLQEK